MMVLSELNQEVSMLETLGSREGRAMLWRRWQGRVPLEASELVPLLFELLDDKEEEIQNARKDRDALVEAFVYERGWKAAV